MDGVSGAGRGTCLVSVLGLGPKTSAPPYYDQVQYEWDGCKATATPLLAAALVELFEVERVVLLGSPEVRERWVDSRLVNEYLGSVPLEFRQVPNGGDESELWEIFRVTRSALTDWKDGLPERILVDLTHGWGIQRLIAGAALAFVQSEWQRRGSEVPQLRVLYGALDAAEGGEARPIWDISNILAAARFDAAIDAMIRYGRGDDFAALCDVDTRVATARGRERGLRGSDLRPSGHLKHLGQSVQRLTDDLALGRAADVVRKSAPKVRDRLDDDGTQHWIAELPLLEGAVDQLRDWVMNLCGEPSLVGRAGAVVMLRLALQYQRTQRFAEQAAALREGLVTLAALQLGMALCEPNSPGAKQTRHVAERRLGELTRMQQSAKGRSQLDDSLSPALRDCVALAADVQEVRNDIEHLGLNDQPVSSQALRKRLRDATQRFGALLGETCSTDAGSDGLPRLQPSAVFLNLSNHPLATWPLPQQEAVRTMGFEAPIELDGGLPLVPVEADESTVLDLARDIAERAVAQSAVGAFVATDFSLTFALVTALQARGVRCFSAVARRETEVTPMPDGSRKRETRYEFLRFREYLRGH